MIHTGETYTRDENPDWRVRIYYDEIAGAPHEEWDMVAGSHNHRNVITLWDHRGPNGWMRNLRDDEYAKYLPSDGIVIGLDYAESVHGPGTGHMRPHASDSPSDWDGYFHVTEAHWREIMGDTPFTPEKVREALELDCKVITDWMRGQVYGWQLERKTVWTNDRGKTMTTWEPEDSCWGYYGLDEWDRMADEGFDAIPSE